MVAEIAASYTLNRRRFIDDLFLDPRGKRSACSWHFHDAMQNQFQQNARADTDQQIGRQGW